MYKIYSLKLISTCCRENGLYILNELKVSVAAAAAVDLSSFHLSHSSCSFYLWNLLLGHVLSSRLRFFCIHKSFRKFVTL